MRVKTDVLGVLYDNVTMQEALEQGRTLLEGSEAAYCVTPNAEMAYEALHDEGFREVLNAASLVLADGAGVVLGAKILKTQLKQKVAGIEFAQNLLPILEETGKRLFLLGSKPGIAELAAEKMLEKHPKLCVCGTMDGYFKEAADAVRRVNEANADVLYVCLGAPKQEIFMSKLKPYLNRGVMIGVGAVFNFRSGIAERRAPQWAVKSHLEFVWRLFSDPRKQWPRVRNIITALPSIIREEKRRARMCP